jgi:hypothetical protein
MKTMNNNMVEDFNKVVNACEYGNLRLNDINGWIACRYGGKFFHINRCIYQ